MGFREKRYKKVGEHDREIPQSLHRGSYMSAHVLMNLLNELRKSDKMRGLPSFLFFFFATSGKPEKVF